MPPHAQQTHPPAQAQRAGPAARSQPTVPVPSRQSGHARMQVVTDPTSNDDNDKEDTFNLHNISGLNSDDGDNQPAPQQRSRTQGSNPVVPENTGVNDVGVAPLNSKNAAADTRYFFEKFLDKYVCKECK
jgi:hypothetical protein